MKKTSKKKTPPRRKRVAPARAKKLKKIGIFGGTFDPIHYGHLNSIETLQAQLKLDEILVIPANQNPFRMSVCSAGGEHRIEMARRALNDLERFPSVRVVADEIERGGVSYTVDTVRALKAKMRGAEFYLCMGADQLNGFNGWREYEKLLTLVHLVVTTRPGYEFKLSKERLPGWLQAELKALRGSRGQLKSKKTIQFVTLRDIDVSASDVRRKLRRGESVEHLTPSSVIQYVSENALYTPRDRKVDDYRQFTKYCAKVAADHGGINIQSYDLRELSQPAEFSIVMTGTSTRHTRALAESIVKQARDDFDIYPQSTEGAQEGRWIIVDYGSLMIHIFFDYVRTEYRIENLWEGAARIELP